MARVSVHILSVVGAGLLALSFSCAGKSSSSGGIAGSQSGSAGFRAVVPGVVTAADVYITADDGSYLPETKSVGDRIYIVTQPKEAKKGWVRVTNTAEDTIGIGWVESKYVRAFSEYRAGSSGGGGIPPGIPVEDEGDVPLDFGGDMGSDFGGASGMAGLTSDGAYQNVAVLPLGGEASGGTMEASVHSTFIQALEKDGRLQILNQKVAGQNVDASSENALANLASSTNLDGFFVGQLSSPVGSNRLLQMKFFGAAEQTFVLEKVTRIPLSGDSTGAIESLADQCLQALFK